MGLILALSGGADSVFLGEMLFHHGFKDVTVAHFNHNLRSVESDRDEQFSSECALRWGYKFVSEKWKNSVASEEKARHARYKFLESVRVAHNADYILLAHHTDDNTETILFNFLRGTGAKGLAGISALDEKRHIMRPLLNLNLFKKLNCQIKSSNNKKVEQKSCSENHHKNSNTSLNKQGILAYLKENKISYREDSSNQDTTFTRNFIRQELFPLIKTRFPKASEALNRSAEIFRASADFSAEMAQNWISENHTKSHGISRQIFEKTHSHLQSEILRKIWQKRTLDSEQIQRIKKFIFSAKSGKSMDIKEKKLKIYGDNFFVE